MFLIAANSSGAVPFGESALMPSSCRRNYIRLLGTLLLIVLLWFGISAPLSSVGAYFGSRTGVRLFVLFHLVFIFADCPHEAIPHPVRVHTIPRQIPPPPKYLRPWVRYDSPSDLYPVVNCKLRLLLYLAAFSHSAPPS